MTGHPPGRLLGIDFGLSRIGLAVSDALGISTQALGFVQRENDAQAARVVAAVAAQQQAAALVIGLPLHANGDAGENVKLMRVFAAELAKHCALPIHEVDERHSSQEAEDLLRREGAWPAKPGMVDAKVAAILLRRYLAEGGGTGDADSSEGSPSV